MVSDIQIANYYIDFLLCQKQIFSHHCELKLLEKLTLKTPNYQSKKIDFVYLNQANAFRETFQSESIFPNIVGSPKPIKEKHIHKTP